jgi:hypothetical protein
VAALREPRSPVVADASRETDLAEHVMFDLAETAS